MKKIIIIGGSRFIGTNLVQYYFGRRSWKVINLDCLPPRNSKHLDYYREIDILNESGLIQAIKSFFLITWFT